MMSWLQVGKHPHLHTAGEFVAVPSNVELLPHPVRHDTTDAAELLVESGSG